MRLFTILPVICISALALVSCSKMVISDDIPFSITTTQTKDSPDDDTHAKLSFSTVFFQKDPEYKDCLWFNAHTDGKMVYGHIWLSMYLKERSLVVGKEPEIERFTFCLPFSSDSRNYAGFEKGRIIVKERGKDRIVLRFTKARFDLAMGTFILNGDLVFPRRTEE